MSDYCYSCGQSGIETEAGHFVGPKASRPLLTDKKGRPLCDFHWWLMFESSPSRGGTTWAEYVQEWKKPDLPEMTWPPEETRTAEIAKFRKKG